jgi:hypothetical protein
MHHSSEYGLTKRLGPAALPRLSSALGSARPRPATRVPATMRRGNTTWLPPPIWVVAGDDLDAIPERSGVTLEVLTKVNKLSPTQIEVGQRLAIPSGPAGTAASSASTTAGIPGLGALTGPPANPQFKYSTPMPPGTAVPDSVETRLGTLKFFDGFLDKATADKLWNALDFQRAVQAYLPAIPAVSQAADRDACRTSSR